MTDKKRKTNLIHLHLHTDSSFLDGVGRPEEYAALAKKYGMDACAITDHGNLHGLPNFERAMKAQGVKPIYGCEFYLNAKRDEAKEVRTKTHGKQASGFDPMLKNHHQLLLAMNQEGWQNLLKLNHDCVRNGYYYYPRTTVDMIIEHNAGLICTTTCTTSVFSRILNTPGTPERARVKACRNMIARYKEAFGDRFYFEIQPWDYDEQRVVNSFLFKEFERQKIQPVMTCDVHYATKEDKSRQKETLAGMQGITVDYAEENDKFLGGSTNNYFMTARNALDLYVKNQHAGGKPFALKAIKNTQVIADRCNVELYTDDTLKPPIYRHDNGELVEDAFETLKKQSIAGFKKLIMPHIDKKKVPAYKARLKKELDIINRCQMSNFYLVTADVCRECLRRGILVWVRGSGCASLIAACLEISRQDPMKYNLLFERFIDPSRPNAPDFDLDLDATRRQEIVDYITAKYGGEDQANIARIIAIQTYGLKSALNSVCRARGIDSSIAWKLSDTASLLVVDKSVEASLGACTPDERTVLFAKITNQFLKVSDKKIAQFIESHPDIIEAAFTLVGRRKGRSKHAAGYVITPTPIADHLPIDRLPGDRPKEHVICTAWGEGQASTDISPTGLMKLDLLPLDTITVVSRTVRMATKRHNRPVIDEINSWTMDFTDEKVAAEFSSGQGIGLHQLSEVDQGLAKFAAELKPKRVEDVIAMIAMYRPGSIEFLEKYKKRAHGREEVDLVHPVYDAIVAETFGIIVYQEQIMHILNQIGNIELRGAYMIIKAISKKKEKIIQQSRDEFLVGAKSHGMSKPVANEIFDLIEKFAGYGFNKAHATSYAELSWVTAYLRAHYPLEFYASLLNSTPNKAKKKKGQKQDRKVELVMRQAQKAGLKIVPPVAGLSSSEWRISKNGALIAPLSIINKVGEKPADNLRDAYKKHRFANLFELLEWAGENKSMCNAGVLKACAKVNAFKHLGVTVPQAIDLINEWSLYKPSKRNGTQTEQLKETLKENGSDIYRTIDEPDVRMFHEREALGFAFWCNPWSMNSRLDKVVELARAGRIHGHDDKRLRDKRRAFLVTGIRPHTDKNGGKMAFLTLSNINGDIVKAIAFARTWKKCKMKVDSIYLLAGTYDRKGEYLVSDLRKPAINLDSVAV